MRTDEYRLAVDLVKAGDYEGVRRDLDHELQDPNCSVALPFFPTDQETESDEETDSLRWPIELLRGDIELLRGMPTEAEVWYAAAVATALRECQPDELQRRHGLSLRCQWLYQFGCEVAWRWGLVRPDTPPAVPREFPGDDSWGLHPDDATGLDALSVEAPAEPNRLAAILYEAARAAFEAVRGDGDDDQWLLAMHALVWLAEEAKDWGYVLTISPDFWEAWHEEREFSDAFLDRSVARDFASIEQLALIHLILEKRTESVAGTRLGSAELADASAHMSRHFGDLWNLVPSHAQEKIATAELVYRAIRHDTHGMDWSVSSSLSWEAAEIYFSGWFLPKIREHTPRELAEMIVVRRSRDRIVTIRDACDTLINLQTVKVHNDLHELLVDVTKIANVIKDWAPKRNNFTHVLAQGVEEAQRMHYIFLGDENEPGVIKRMAEVVCRLS